MINRFVKDLAQCGYINPEQEEIIAFGLKEGVCSLSGIAVALLLGYLIGIGIQALVFLAVFIPLRMYAGGYHAETRSKCAVQSVILIVIVFLVLRYWSMPVGYTVVIGFLSAGIIANIGAADNRNHRFTAGERLYYSKNSRRILLIESVILVITGIMRISMVADSIAAALLLEVFMVLAGGIIHKTGSNPNK